MRVKACEASDGHGGHVLPLSDPEGCIVRPKLLGKFSKVSERGVNEYKALTCHKYPI
jgi:hypothetical protein